jgi:hypothetical protein
MAGYLTGGRPDRALALTAGSTLDPLLWSDEPDAAIMMALAGYALLKVENGTKNLYWAEDFANKREWLPDGAVIFAAAQGRDGNVKQAMDYLGRAEQRGLPYFSSGLSLLAAEAESLANTYKMPGAAEIFSRWRGLAAAADYSALCTTLRIDPLWRGGFSPNEGWRPSGGGVGRKAAAWRPTRKVAKKARPTKPTPAHA